MIAALVTPSDGAAISAVAFKAEVAAWAERIGVKVKEVQIRSMTRKWGSCSSNGRLTFDVGLLRQPVSKRREVIVHELLHLKLPNHGRLFRSLSRAYLAPYPGEARADDAG